MQIVKADSARTCPGLTKANYGVLIYTIAKKLSDNQVGGPQGIEFNELRGWAQLGVARAIDAFRSDRLSGDTVDMTRRLCMFILKKGYFLAIDAMRSAQVISRYRHGKFYGGTIQSCHLHEGNGRSQNDVGEKIHGNGSIDPQEAVSCLDLVDTVLSHLTGNEAEVFKLRYKDGMELSEIPDKVGLSGARVYVIHSVLLNKIRTYLSKKNRRFGPNCIPLAA